MQEQPATAGTSSTESADSRRAQFTRYWNSPAAVAWVTLQDRLDAMFKEVSSAALDVANPTRGEQALDVGCGCGGTTLDLARRVATSGHVTGVDISAPMLERARERAAKADLGNVTLTLADAGAHPFPPASFDVVFSRVGVMFFAEPVAAFANLRQALRPSGRMVFLSCRSAAENHYITTAVDAAMPLLTNVPPGLLGVNNPMFSLAGAAHTRALLESAGFREVTLQPLDGKMLLGGPGAAADAAAFSLQFGPLTRVLTEATPAVRGSILQAVTDSYRRLEGPAGIALDGAFWIVSARP